MFEQVPRGPPGGDSERGHAGQALSGPAIRLAEGATRPGLKKMAVSSNAVARPHRAPPAECPLDLAPGI